MFDHALHLLSDKEVASIAPTSKKCVQRICSSINFATAKVLVEYGPGDGAFTHYLLNHMRPDARLIVIETNREFITTLHSRFTDQRLEIVHDDAQNVLRILALRNIDQVDCIVCGIPFSFLSERIKENILRDTAITLKSRGEFIVYQSLMAPEGLKSLRAKLHKYFKINETYSLLLNLPPLYVFHAGMGTRAATHSNNQGHPSRSSETSIERQGERQMEWEIPRVSAFRALPTSFSPGTEASQGAHTLKASEIQKRSFSKKSVLQLFREIIREIPQKKHQHREA